MNYFLKVLQSVTLAFYTRYEHYFSAIMFFAGFLWDTLTLARIDASIGHVIIFVYLCLAGISIFLIQFFESREMVRPRVVRFFPFILQFIFGALLSAIFIYYFRSTSFVGSWFFLFLLGGILVGNEFLRKRYRLLEFQLNIFFVILFAFMIFYIPILLGRISVDTFILAGFASVLIIFLFISALLHVIPRGRRVEMSKKLMFGIILSYILFNILYFMHIIPPIPLVLKEADVYHLIERDRAGVYIAIGESRNFYDRYVAHKTLYHHEPGKPVYFFSAVFAPTKFQTPLAHEWQYFNEANNIWITSTRITFPISGGRENGYRAYSLKENITPGKWRVLVETENGAVLGGEVFTVVDVVTPAPQESYRL